MGRSWRADGGLIGEKVRAGREETGCPINVSWTIERWVLYCGRIVLGVAFLGQERDVNPLVLHKKHSAGRQIGAIPRNVVAASQASRRRLST